jgi:transposase-like protein
MGHFLRAKAPKRLLPKQKRPSNRCWLDETRIKVQGEWRIMRFMLGFNSFH